MTAALIVVAAVLWAVWLFVRSSRRRGVAATVDRIFGVTPVTDEDWRRFQRSMSRTHQEETRR